SKSSFNPIRLSPVCRISTLDGDGHGQYTRKNSGASPCPRLPEPNTRQYSLYPAGNLKPTSFSTCSISASEQIKPLFGATVKDAKIASNFSINSLSINLSSGQLVFHRRDRLPGNLHDEAGAADFDRQ